MAVDAKRQLQFWGIGFAIFVLVFWLLGSTLLPFLLGAALAYFLDPLADRLERLGLSRTLATAVIATSAILVFVLVLVLVVPALIEQIQGLVAAMPDYIAGLIAVPRPALPGASSASNRRSCATSPTSRR